MTRSTASPALDPAPAPEGLPPAFTAWFAQRGWQPHGHQLAVLAEARAGRHAFLVAPTGGGKTLAGFLPSLVELAEAPTPGLHTIYVSPLKALAADIARNLEVPIAEIGLPIRCEARTGDTTPAQRARQRRRPPQILLTTPESLSLMLSFPHGERLFGSVRRIVVDEVQALAPNKRGDLLTLALSRLQNLAPAARRIGLSATIDDVGGYRGWLAPGGDAETVALVEAPLGPEPKIDILVPRSRLPWSGHMAIHALPDIYAAIARRRTTLVFVNTRAQAELVFQGLWRLNEDKLAIALHHGSLSREQRIKVERAMAAGRLRAVVATSSLDLGIDWGDVDLVVQVGAPKGASRLIQRIGRANHRLDSPSEALLVPANRFEYLECEAALDAVRAVDLDGDPLRAGALDVLAQHVLGTACAGPFDPDALFAEVRAAAPYAALPRATFDRVIDFVSTGGYALRSYERYRRLRPLPDGRLALRSGLFARQYRMNAGVIVEAPMLSVRVGRGKVLGQVEEYFAMGLSPGDTFIFAGRLLEFEGIQETVLQARAARGATEPQVPAYAGGRLPLTTNLARRVRGLLNSPARWPALSDDVREWLDLQTDRSVLPSPEGLLVETFPRGRGKAERAFLVAYCFEGRNAHQTLGMLLTRRMARAGLVPLGFVATDYVLAVWSLHPVEDMASLFDQDMLGDDLEEWMAESSMLRRSFRNVAVIAGLIERRHPGREKTGRQVTFNSDLIYDVLRKHEPDHLLIEATHQDAAAGLTDIRRLADMLKRIRGKITHRRLSRVSPLAVPVLLEIGKESVLDDGVDDVLGHAAELIAEATGEETVS